MMSEWDDAQEFERAWWGSCVNTFAEETKQLTYAYKMGLTATSDGGRWPVYDLGGARVLDIGGGPTSILLRSINIGPASMVVDPCRYPDWVRERYAAAGVAMLQRRAEDLSSPLQYDEVWLYNVLQHTDDPELIAKNARRSAPVIRVFEWIDFPASEGHPQALTEAGLNEWFDVTGTTEHLNENFCQGRAWFGSVKTTVSVGF